MAVSTKKQRKFLETADYDEFFRSIANHGIHTVPKIKGTSLFLYEGAIPVFQYSGNDGYKNLQEQSRSAFNFLQSKWEMRDNMLQAQVTEIEGLSAQHSPIFSSLAIVDEVLDSNGGKLEPKKYVLITADHDGVHQVFISESQFRSYLTQNYPSQSELDARYQDRTEDGSEVERSTCAREMFFETAHQNLITQMQNKKPVIEARVAKDEAIKLSSGLERFKFPTLNMPTSQRGADNSRFGIAKYPARDEGIKKFKERVQKASLLPSATSASGLFTTDTTSITSHSNSETSVTFGSKTPNDIAWIYVPGTPNLYIKVQYVKAGQIYTEYDKSGKPDTKTCESDKIIISNCLFHDRQAATGRACEAGTRYEPMSIKKASDRYGHLFSKSGLEKAINSMSIKAVVSPDNSQSLASQPGSNVRDPQATPFAIMVGSRKGPKFFSSEDQKKPSTSPRGPINAFLLGAQKAIDVSASRSS